MGPQRKSKTLPAADKSSSSSQYEEEQPAIPMHNQNPNPNPHQSSDESSDSGEKTLKSHTKKGIVSATAHTKKSASQETIPTLLPIQIQDKPILNSDQSSDYKSHEKQGQGFKTSVPKQSADENQKDKKIKRKINESEKVKHVEHKGTIGKDEIVETLMQKEKRLKVELERTRLEVVKEQTEDLIKSFSYVTE